MTEATPACVDCLLLLGAVCRFCGLTGMPHEYLAVNPACSGQCIQAPSKRYPKEYRPPV